MFEANFLKFSNFSGRYENKPDISTSRYFALSVESDCISSSSICKLSSALATSRAAERGASAQRPFLIFKILKFYNRDLFSLPN